MVSFHSCSFLLVPSVLLVAGVAPAQDDPGRGGVVAAAAVALPASRGGDIDDAVPVDEAFVFDGSALYLGVGVGALADVGPADADDEATLGGRLAITLPLGSRYLSFDGALVYGAFGTVDHHAEQVTALEATIVAGLRIAGAPDDVLRPYLSPRVAHLHFFPDPWGDHDPAAGGGTENHAVHHRWGAGAGAGLELGLGGPRSRWRLGFDLEVLAVTGPGIDLVAHTVITFGVGF